jgi:hypothetical protein
MGLFPLIIADVCRLRRTVVRRLDGVDAVLVVCGSYVAAPVHAVPGTHRV